MNCDNAMELLPWRANGSLAEVERRELDEHLSGCPACQREMAETRLAAEIYAAHPTADQLYDLVAGKAAPSGSELIERHVASCSTCAEELSMIRDSQGLLADAEERDRRREGSVVRGPWGVRSLAPARSWVPLALAAAMALAVLGPVVVWVSSHSGWGTPAVMAAKTVDLPVQILRGGEPEPATPPVIRRGDGPLVLHLHNQGWDLAPGVTVELIDEAERLTLVPQEQVEQGPGAVRVRIDAGKLPLGLVTVSVLDAERQPRGEASFRVER